MGHRDSTPVTQSCENARLVWQGFRLSGNLVRISVHTIQAVGSLNILMWWLQEIRTYHHLESTKLWSFKHFLLYNRHNSKWLFCIQWCLKRGNIYSLFFCTILVELNVERTLSRTRWKRWGNLTSKQTHLHVLQFYQILENVKESKWLKTQTLVR